MTETNGKKLHISDTLQAVRRCVDAAEVNALADMKGNLDYVRRFLLGGVREDGTWPAGDMWFSFDGHELEIRISIRSLEVECRYSSDSWHGLLERVDNDLEHNTVPWKLDYTGRKRVENKLKSGLAS